MTEKTSAASISAIKNTFNLLKEWREAKEVEKDHFSQADRLLKDSDDEIRQMKRQNARDFGRDISKAGASGIDISSFNDAFLSTDLENTREIYNRQKQTTEDVRALKKQGENEKKNKRKKTFSYSVGLFSDLLGLGG